MLSDHEMLNALILRIYDAALDDVQWISLVQDIAQLIKAHDSIFFGSPDTGNDQMMIFSPMTNADSNAPAAYKSHYWKQDIWKAGATRYGLTHRGAIFHGDHFIERSMFQNTEMYCDFFKPMIFENIALEQQKKKNI